MSDCDSTSALPALQVECFLGTSDELLQGPWPSPAVPLGCLDASARVEVSDRDRSPSRGQADASGFSPDASALSRAGRPGGQDPSSGGGGARRRLGELESVDLGACRGGWRPSGGWAVGRGAGGVGTAGRAAIGSDGPRPEAADSSLEHSGKSCNSEAKPPVAEYARERFEVRPKRCKCGFCPRCQEVMGWNLRRRVTAALSPWSSVFMLTLTLDPELFGSPEEGYRWVRSSRAVSLLVQDLWRRGLIRSRRFFYVLEWTKKGWPHWHLLVEARYVPHREALELWGRRRPPGIERKPGRPGLGWVKYSAPKFGRRTVYAANYATKYLIKSPEHGWPAWVMDFEGNIARYGVSRGFWGRGKPRPVKLGRDGHEPGCFCEACRGESRRKSGSARERVARCCKGSLVMRVVEEVAASGEVVGLHRSVIAELPTDVRWAARCLGLGLEFEVLQVSEREASRLCQTVAPDGCAVREKFERWLCDHVPF